MSLLVIPGLIGLGAILSKVIMGNAESRDDDRRVAIQNENYFKNLLSAKDREIQLFREDSDRRFTEMQQHNARYIEVLKDAMRQAGEQHNRSLTMNYETINRQLDIIKLLMWFILAIFAAFIYYILYTSGHFSRV
jgi:hypothetical protein